MTQDRKILSEILDRAKTLITGDRAKQHGDLVANHQNIAGLWSSYLNHELSAYDVAVMMALLKIARTKTGTFNEDDYVDAIGYLAIARAIVDENKRWG